ncbi:MAG TPA: alpha/beta hydrolase [Steroidobacteraceae bacterium]
MAKGSTVRGTLNTQPRVRRGYFECRYGQLHVHNAIPPGGGFEEGTALLCLHQTPLTGRVFRQLLPVMGRDRSVYAPDLPGFGESDPVPTRPTIQDYAAGVVDFLDSMRFRQIDVLGMQMGALVAAELALARPQQVRRVVLVSVPVFSEAESEAIRRSQPPVPAEDGSHLLIEWQRTLESRGGRVSIDVAVRNFADKMHNGPHAFWGMSAAASYPAADRLALVTQPTLLLKTRDEGATESLRAKELMPRARVIELAQGSNGLFESHAESLAGPLREFLKS